MRDNNIPEEVVINLKPNGNYKVDSFVKKQL